MTDYASIIDEITQNREEERRRRYDEKKQQLQRDKDEVERRLLPLIAVLDSVKSDRLLNVHDLRSSDNWRDDKGQWRQNMWPYPQVSSRNYHYAAMTGTVVIHLTRSGQPALSVMNDTVTINKTYVGEMSDLIPQLLSFIADMRRNR